MSKTFYFYENNVKIESFKNDENLIVDDISFSEQIKLHYFDNCIIILPSDGCEFVTQLETIKKCVLNSDDDIVVLKYLFEKYGLIFYDDNFKECVSHLNRDKEPILYDTAIRTYIVDCMCYYGIVSDEKKLEYVSLDKKIVNVVNNVRRRRMKKELLLSKIKLFFLKLYVKIKFW